MSTTTELGFTETIPAQETRPAAVPRFMSVRQVAEYLDIHEKKVYSLAAEGLIPATKVTGKWLFPRDLVDQWLRETSHGGILSDRLMIAGGDDPLLCRAITQLAIEIQARALVSSIHTGTQLGLSLLARRRADVCAIHWGPADEADHRHPAVIRPYPQHRDWTIVRAFHREQGLIVSPARHTQNINELFATGVRWAMRQEGAGSQRFLRDTLALHGVDPSNLRITARANSEREAAALIAMDHADVGPGVRAAAAEFGLEFVPIGWEAYDLVLYRGIYFRTLFQRLLGNLQGMECRRWAQLLGGYDFRDAGKLIATD